MGVAQNKQKHKEMMSKSTRRWWTEEEKKRGGGVQIFVSEGLKVYPRRWPFQDGQLCIDRKNQFTLEAVRRWWLLEFLPTFEYRQSLFQNWKKQVQYCIIWAEARKEERKNVEGMTKSFETKTLFVQRHCSHPDK